MPEQLDQVATSAAEDENDDHRRDRAGASCTWSARPFMPRRMSVWPVASQTRVADGRPITVAGEHFIHGPDRAVIESGPPRPDLEPKPPDSVDSSSPATGRPGRRCRSTAGPKPRSADPHREQLSWRTTLSLRRTFDAI